MSGIESRETARGRSFRLLPAGLLPVAFLVGGCIFGDVKQLKTDVAELEGQVNSLQVTSKDRLGDVQRNFQSRQATVSQRVNELESKVDSLRGELARTSYEMQRLQRLLSTFEKSVSLSSRSMRDSLSINLELLEMGMMARITRRDSVYLQRLSAHDRELVALNRKMSRELENLRDYVEKVKETILEVLTEQELSAGTPSSPRYHTIQPGDTLWQISQKYKVSIEAIKKANGLTGENPTLIVGKRLIIPT